MGVYRGRGRGRGSESTVLLPLLRLVGWSTGGQKLQFESGMLSRGAALGSIGGGVGRKDAKGGCWITRHVFSFGDVSCGPDDCWERGWVACRRTGVLR